MAGTLLAKCPGCKKAVRVPEEWAERTVRCKHCGMVCQAKPTAAAQARQAKPALAAIAVAQPVTDSGAAGDPFAVTATAITAQPHMHHAPAGDPFAMLEGSHDGTFSPGAPRSRRQQSRGWLPAIVGLAVLLLGVGIAAFAVKYFFALQQRDKLSEIAGTTKTGPADNRAATEPAPPMASVVFPRRLLGISVNNYLYANPISYGTDLDKRTKDGDKHDFGKTLTRIGAALKIPPNQVFELSDGAVGAKMRPPLKPIIEQTITRYLDTCRAQDRIILIFVGHSLESEGKPYLVPLEGDLEDAKTLIPLEWLMQQLDKCPAQQKLFIADLNRYDPSRGFERPSGGKLSAKVEGVLKNPPAGVQVWSTCSADQYSHEYDDYMTFRGVDIKGGAFLNFFFEAFRKGLGGITRADDPLPLPALSKEVNDLTVAMFTRTTTDDKMKVRTLSEQTPFLAGDMKGDTIAPDPNEAPPPVLEMPTPASVFAKGLADKNEITRLLDELALPPIRQARATAATVRFDTVVPFTTEAMSAYKADYKSIKEIMAKEDKYPLRVATLKAIERLRDLGKNSSIDLPEELRNSASDQFKATLKNLQKGPARIMDELREIVEMLEKAGEERKGEKSKRWQAHYDFVLAIAKAKYAYIHEYSLMTGVIRRDALPELPKQKGMWGWRLASVGKLTTGNKDVLEHFRDARKLFDKIIKENPGTPWEVLAKRERMTALGLEWVPTNFGADAAGN